MYALYAAYETVTHPAGEIISTHRSPKNAYRALLRCREPRGHLAVGCCYHGERKGDQFGKEPRHET